MFVQNPILKGRRSYIFIFHSASPLGAGFAIGLFFLSSMLIPGCLESSSNKRQVARTEAERLLLRADSLFDIRQFSHSLRAYRTATTACQPGSQQWIYAQRQVAANLWRTHQADSAFALCQRLLPRAEADLGKKHPEIAQLMIIQGNTHCDRRTDDGLAAALACFEPALRILEAHYPPKHPEIALGYDRLLIAYWLNDEYPKALDMAQRAFEHIDTSDLASRPVTIKLQSHKGLVLRSAGRYALALKAFEEAYRLEDKRASNTRISDHLMEMAQTHTDMGDPYEALYLLQRALAIEEAQGDQGTKTPAYLHEFMGNAYRSMGHLDSAIAQYQISLLHWNPQIGDDVNGYKEISLLLGKTWLEKGQTREAIGVLGHTLRIAQKHFGADNFNVCPILQALGEAYFAQSKLADAERLYRRALTIALAKVGQNHPKTGELLGFLAALQLKKGQKQKALSTIIQAEGAFYTATSPAFVTDYIGLIKAKHLEGKILLTYSDRMSPVHPIAATHVTGPGHSDRMTRSHPVTMAIQAFKKGIELADSVRLGLGSQIRPLAVQKEVVDIAESALGALSVQGDGRKETLSDAFFFMEKSKAATLRAAFQKVLARTQAGLPESVSLQEEKYKAKLRYTLQHLQDETADTDAGTRLRHIESCARARATLDSFEQALGRAYPQYFSLKTAIQLPRLGQLDTFARAQQRCVVSFFWGKTHCYAFVVGSNGQKWLNIGPSAAVEATIRAVLTAVRQPPAIFVSDADALAQMRGFCTASYHAFQQIIQPLGLYNSQNLTVIPDGPLYYLPFEALLSARPDATAMQHLDYRNLPYLALDIAINFENSAEILLKTEPFTQQKVNYVGFAPSYEHSGLPILYHNTEEVRLAQARLGGKVFVQEAATCQAFYRHYSGADLLHLACHSVMDGRSNEKSYFAFAQNGKIHWYDLYNLRLRARLAVLSACNTNDGSWATGEGVSSLSAALHYAGCKAMLATRWPVNDAAASQYVGLLFAALSSNAGNLGQAHREAIKNYMKNTQQTRKCHPFYWAGFVVYD